MAQLKAGSTVGGKEIATKELSLQEYVLFSGSSSTLITLSESVIDFKKVIIYFNDGVIKSSINIDGNGTWNITMNHSGSFGDPIYYALRVKSGNLTVNNKNITISAPGSNYAVDLKTTGTFVFYDNVTTWYVTKVVGYK